MKDVIVIGAGASGIIAALKLAEKNRVTLLEKNDKIGKKILVTGNGKCNLWNKNLFNENLNIKDFYYTDDFNKLEKILEKRFEVYKYLTEELGIYTKEKNNYIYPYSQTAASIRETLERKLLNNKNIEVVTNFEVTKIEKKDKYYIYSNNDYYTCDKLIISPGSKSSNLGTNSLDNLVKDVKINKESPSLVPIKLNERFLKELNGIRSDVKLSLYIDGKFIKEEIGEIQFTDYGISGIVTFNLSGYISRSKGESYFSIDFINDINSLDLNKDETMENVLETLINYKLLFVLLKEANIDKNKKANSLTKEEQERLMNILKNLKVKIDEPLDFSRSQVTTGGISLEEINLDLSLIKDNDIYVTGEILDVDGICGGYNLAFAFITGFIAGESC